jgi:hypothetical protein
MKKINLNLSDHINRFFCSHDYFLVDEFEIKSEFDIVNDSGRTPNTLCSLKRKYIYTYKCDKCKKIKILTHITP